VIFLYVFNITFNNLAYVKPAQATFRQVLQCTIMRV